MHLEIKKFFAFIALETELNCPNVLKEKALPSNEEIPGDSDEKKEIKKWT